MLGIPSELITLQKSNIDTRNCPLLKGPVTGFPRPIILGLGPPAVSELGGVGLLIGFFQQN